MYGSLSPVSVNECLECMESAIYILVDTGPSTETENKNKNELNINK